MYLVKDFEELRKYGFVRDAIRSCYELKLETYNIFVWMIKNDSDYQYKRLYIEYKNGNIVIDDLLVLYQLIIDGVVAYV